MPPQLPWPGHACSARRARTSGSGSAAYWNAVTRSMGSPVTGSIPGWIEPSESISAGALCSSSAASVPTGGLSHATTVMTPAMSLALRCASVLSFTSSRLVSE